LETVPRQVVSIATGSHVVMAAVQGRVLAGVRGGGGCMESTGRLLIEPIRSQLQKASVSWHLVRQIMGKQAVQRLYEHGGVHVTGCICVYTVHVCVCVGVLDVFQIRVAQNSFLRWTICSCFLGFLTVAAAVKSGRSSEIIRLSRHYSRSWKNCDVGKKLSFKTINRKQITV